MPGMEVDANGVCVDAEPVTAQPMLTYMATSASVTQAISWMEQETVSKTPQPTTIPTPLNVQKDST